MRIQFNANSPYNQTKESSLVSFKQKGISRRNFLLDKVERKMNQLLRFKKISEFGMGDVFQLHCDMESLKESYMHYERIRKIVSSRLIID